MEVKSILVDSIMKFSERPKETERQEDNNASSDTVTISPQATKRLFEEIMSHSLQESLRKDLANEGN